MLVDLDRETIELIFSAGKIIWLIFGITGLIGVIGMLCCKDNVQPHGREGDGR